MKIPQFFKRWNLKCLLLLLIYSVYDTNATVTDGGNIRELQQCYTRFASSNLQDVVGKSLSWYCESQTLKRLRSQNGTAKATHPSAVSYVNRIADKLNQKRRSRRVKRQAGGDLSNFEIPKCERKEYRDLSDEERHRFHRAVNALKRDTTILPNKYDALALLHTGVTTDSAHGGPKFLSWHRAYLLMFEMALQEVDERVCLPYWDSSLDSELDDAKSSYVFSPDFLGGGGQNGEVTDGPFAGWETPEDGYLMRNIGNEGELYTLENIERILEQRRTRDIIAPNSLPMNDIEVHHGGCHVFVGGHMGDIRTASFDPTFFLHHCFVDYLWELFRTKQRAMGIDPATDYPEDFGSPMHDRKSDIGLNLNLTSEMAFMDEMTLTYEYKPSPDCNSRRGCGSKYLRCNQQRGRCMPVDPNEPGPDPGPGPGPGPKPKPKPCKKEIRPTQNTYCIDGVCDTSKWVYTAVKVVSVRPPGYTGYESYPVRNGRVSKTSDIYQPSAYAETSRYIASQRGLPKSYKHCDDGNGIGQVYVEATGINYNGVYKEAAIIDQRLMTSVSIAYVAVKNPKNGPVKALFRAFDSCGRLCHTACKIPGTNDYDACSGVMIIEDKLGQPKQYSSSYGQAALDTWGYVKNQDCPSFKTEDISLTFYCDYRDRIPWTDEKAVLNNKLRPGPNVPRPEPPAVNPNECKVEDDCIIDVPCGRNGKRKCDYGETHKCRGQCNTYAVCNYGQYWKRSCPFGWSFNDNWHSCTGSRRCPITPKKKPVVTKPNRHEHSHNHPGRTRTEPAVKSPARNSYFQNLRGRFYSARRRFFG